MGAALVSAWAPVGRGCISLRERAACGRRHTPEGVRAYPRAARLRGDLVCTPRASSLPSGHPGPVRAPGQPPQGVSRAVYTPLASRHWHRPPCPLSDPCRRLLSAERHRARRGPGWCSACPGRALRAQDGALRVPLLALLTRGATGLAPGPLVCSVPTLNLLVPVLLQGQAAQLHTVMSASLSGGQGFLSPQWTAAHLAAPPLGCPPV